MESVLPVGIVSNYANFSKKIFWESYGRDFIQRTIVCDCWGSDTCTHRRCGVEVHRLLGSGFLEIVFQKALAHEFRLRNIPFEEQVRYKKN